MSDSKKPAILGGEPVINRPLAARHSVGAEEKAAVDALFDEAIRTGNTVGYGGPEEEAFCREFAQMMGGGYADGVNSGTTAVHVALKSLDLEPFSEVIVGAITDPGGVMPILENCCIPVFADSAPGSYNTNAEQVEQVITSLTRAIIIPHIGGEPVDMRAICALADARDIPVIEDAAQAHGATLDGVRVGGFGQLAAFSTMFGKHFCTGGQGGVVYTRDEARHYRARQVADRGKPFGLPSGATNCSASLNFNMDEFGAAIGRAQLKKLPGIVEGRRRVAQKLAEGFARIPSVKIPALPSGAAHSYWFWRLSTHPEALRCTKSEFCAALSAEGVPIVPEYKGALVQHMDWFKNRRAFGSGGFPWTAPQYLGTMNRPFPTPNAIDAMRAQYNLMLNESWTDEDISLVLEAYDKVDAYYRS